MFDNGYRIVYIIDIKQVIKRKDLKMNEAQMTPLSYAKTLSDLKISGIGHHGLSKSGVEIDAHSIAYSSTDAQIKAMAMAISHCAYERGIALSPMHFASSLRGDASNFRILLIEFREKISVDISKYLDGKVGHI